MAPSEPPPVADREKRAAQATGSPVDGETAGSIWTRVVSFGPFRLLPARQLLLEGESPVRLGSRALEILIALTERVGEVVSKDALIARVWPNAVVDENVLRVNIASLRRALGDGLPGRRYLVNVPGRGYQFVAPVHLADPEGRPIRPRVAGPNHNLPISKSPLVGRADVVDMLCRQLSRQRLVTIVGIGGIGKTTVALAVAEALLPAYPDGVRFVDLAPIEDPHPIPHALETALGLAVGSNDAISRMAESLKEKQMLIVLDGCEHVVQAAASLAEEILTLASGASVLATSREPLRAEGEQVYRLPPLDVPIDPAGLTASAALEFPAVQLFVDRAAATLNGFELHDGDAPAASDICRKLDGIALAIELAAARIDVFGVRQLAVLLDDRLVVLTLGKRTAQLRHRSLTAALDWSYEFLPEYERLVFCRLAVFVGIFDLASAVAIAGDGDAEILDAIANLVSKSLVSAEMNGTAVRYRLLDTTRAYAIQKLAESGNLQEYMRRHDQHRQADADRNKD